MAKVLTRRRMITVMAAFAGLPLLPEIGRAASGLKTVTWQGQALGAPAMLVLNHEDRSVAEKLLTQVVAEVNRLENIFSIYRDGSALKELNRAGFFAAPPRELVDLLETCRKFHDLSDGLFDPSIQPLWKLYALHFAQPNPDAAGPTESDIKHALNLTDFNKVHFDNNRIAFAEKGAGLTLNGIAQGYVTDRIVELLRNAGISSSLIDMGENRTIGKRQDGTPWRIGLADYENAAHPDRIVEIVDRAVATSSGIGFHFDAAARFSHILNPKSGLTSQRYRRVSVIADDATTADALSTTFSLMAPDRIDNLRWKLPAIEVDLKT